MSNIEKFSETDLTQALAYSGFILVAFELVKSIIVSPIKAFYEDITFAEGMYFKSYEDDVLSRHKNNFEACLLYLRDFMEAIDEEDFLTIQALRTHRNELAHDLPSMLGNLDVKSHFLLLEKTNKALFKLSNFRVYMEIGSDPYFQNKGIDWETVKGAEYMLFEEILGKVSVLKNSYKNA
ncbi:hypothetical protein [Psychromonas sp. SR45-3]|uniref:hypothetical protein n=1 Tax=Psychromonas sp. SR45-3 TaxID=2760930 RepID=UPI0015F84044|nr:hypothetical protein [Psychromonas sp. SR45-3]MBB1274886.1 hypothetical protein [Psychromonas sp. SR45-3]